jgi:hypothetical protein
VLDHAPLELAGRVAVGGKLLSRTIPWPGSGGRQPPGRSISTSCRGSRVLIGNLRPAS